MDTKQFTHTEQVNFWGAHAHDYKGDVVSGYIVNWAKPYTGNTVIDVGAGSGALLRSLRSARPNLQKLVGLDLAPKSSEIMQGSVTQLPFEAGTFDTVFMTDVIEHLSDADLPLALKEMTRVLRSGGHMVITTLNDEDLAAAHINCPSCKAVFHRWGHCQVFSLERFQSIAQTYGLKIVTHKTTNMSRIVRYGLLAKLIYLIGIDRVFRPKSWHDDLLVVLKKA